MNHEELEESDEIEELEEDDPDPHVPDLHRVEDWLRELLLQDHLAGNVSDVEYEIATTGHVDLWYWEKEMRDWYYAIKEGLVVDYNVQKPLAEKYKGDPGVKIVHAQTLVRDIIAGQATMPKPLKRERHARHW